MSFHVQGEMFSNKCLIVSVILLNFILVYSLIRNEDFKMYLKTEKR